MLQLYYYNFCETLKKLIVDEKFFIKTEIFGELYELTYDKNLEHFRFLDSRIIFPKTDDVYKIIKYYITEKITQKQKETLNGEFEKKEVFKLNFNFQNKKEEEIFFKLLKRFEMYLLNEPIFFYDIPLNADKLKLGFPNTEVSQKFLQKLISTVDEYPASLEQGKISSFMWNNLLIKIGCDVFKESLEIFQKEGYIKFNVEEFESNIFNIIFTEKFYKALKLAIFNEVYLKKEIVIYKF